MSFVEIKELGSNNLLFLKSLRASSLQTTLPRRASRNFRVVCEYDGSAAQNRRAHKQKNFLSKEDKALIKRQNAEEKSEVVAGRLLSENETFPWDDDDDLKATESMSEEEKIDYLVERLASLPSKVTGRQFSQLIRSGGMRINRFRAVSILQKLTKRGCWRKAVEVVHWLAERDGQSPRVDRHVYTTLMSSIGDERPREILPIIKIMMEKEETYPDIVAYHVAARIFGRAGCLHELLELISILRARSTPECSSEEGYALPLRVKQTHRIVPDVEVYNQVLNASAVAKEWGAVGWVMEAMQADKVAPNAATYGLAIEVMAECRRKQDAWKLLEEMEARGFSPNGRTFRALVRLEGSARGALGLVADMESRGIVGNPGLYSSLGRALSREGMWEEALQLLPRIASFPSAESNEKTLTGFIQAALKGNHPGACLPLYEALREGTTTLSLGTVNTMISALGSVQGGFSEAWRLYQWVFTGKVKGRVKVQRVAEDEREKGEEERLWPDQHTFVAMLGTCVRAGRWEEASFVLMELKGNGWAVEEGQLGWMETDARVKGGVKFADELRESFQTHVKTPHDNYQPAEANMGGYAPEKLPPWQYSPERDNPVTRKLRGVSSDRVRYDWDLWKYAICMSEQDLSAQTAYEVCEEASGLAENSEMDPSVLWDLVHSLLYCDVGPEKIMKAVEIVSKCEQSGCVDVSIYERLIIRLKQMSAHDWVVEMGKRMKARGIVASGRIRGILDEAKVELSLMKRGKRGEKGSIDRGRKVVPSAEEILALWKV